MPALRLLVALPLACAAVAAADPGVAAADTVVAAHVVSATRGSDEVPSSAAKRALAEDGVTLWAVLETETEAGARRFYSDAPRVRLGRRTVETRPLDDAPFAVILWYKVEPAVESMSNTSSGRFRFEPIEYTETLVGLMRGRLAANVRPTATPDYGDGVGTMRFKIAAHTRRGVVASPGAEARRGRGSGGLSDRVHRISLRSDDTYLGYLTEMYGQPYIWASGGATTANHQSERLEGSDCADFVVYGARRMGKSIPYTWTGGLTPYTRRLARGALADDGIYRDDDGDPLPFPRAGDLILFPRHVGVLTADRGEEGVLDIADVMMHTLFASPHEEAIATSGYADNPVEVLRWR